MVISISYANNTFQRSPNTCRMFPVSLDGTCTRDPNMNLIIQYGLLGLVLGLGLILYCRIWRPLALPYMCPQPKFQTNAIDRQYSTCNVRQDLAQMLLKQRQWSSKASTDAIKATVLASRISSHWNKLRITHGVQIPGCAPRSRRHQA